MGGESRKQRKRMPVLPVAGGELTLQAGQVAADRQLMFMTVQPSKAQRTSELFPESQTGFHLLMCVLSEERGSFISASP